ncbi:MAG: hypothetical protein SFU99_23225 [Saprospiraceae bacterium]|nr:hypothetical protein [Saprospiraceae bacterium]
MKTTKLVAIVILLTGLSLSAKAQSYQNAIGLRLGYPLSVSYKHFFSEQNAGEVFAGFRSYAGYGWFNLGALYEHHKPISGLDGLNWYFGGGASVFFWNYDNDFIGADSTTSIGILGTLGLDYKFADAPVNVSLDWVPVFFVNGYGSGFAGGYGALSVRYVLGE